MTERVPIISTTGRVHGWGKDPYKWVSYLTGEERAAVRAEQLVVVLHGASTHGGHPPYRKVIYSWGRYQHRVPDKAEQTIINLALDAQRSGGRTP